MWEKISIGQAGSVEAITNMEALIKQNRGRHVMQVNKRVKGRTDNVRLIDGEHRFTGAQNANTARGTTRKDNVEFGDTGTFVAKDRIAGATVGTAAASAGRVEGA